MAAPSFYYENSPFSWTVGTNISPLSTIPTMVGGPFSDFSATPPMPAGVILGNSGAITGIPLAGLALTTFTITATNFDNYTTSTTIQVTITIPPNSFVALVTVGNTAYPSLSINLPYLASGAGVSYTGTIYWGDNLSDDNLFVRRSHTYAAGGSYIITVDGLIHGWNNSNYFLGSDLLYLVDILNFGPNFLFGPDVGQYFTGCNNLVHIAPLSSTILSQQQNLSNMFAYCVVLENIDDISDWNVSHVTNMSFMFYYTFLFNTSLSAWQTGSVTDMNSMFFAATNFDKDISQWNTSQVQNMYGMFAFASKFNSNLNTNLNHWNVSNVTDMSGMFSAANAFNKDISNWNVSNVMFMDYMFQDSLIFNQPLANWIITPALTSAVNFISNLVYSPRNLTDIYNAWAQLPNPPYNLAIDITANYIFDECASNRNDVLLAQYGWQITDNGPLSVVYNGDNPINL